MANPTNTNNTNQKTFSVQIVGENTGTIYVGDFTVTKYLSNRQRFLQDQLFRRYLGGDPTFAAADTVVRSRYLSEINAYCSNHPEFWVKADGGLDIPDNNVLEEIYEELVKIFDEVAQERDHKVKEAAARLKAVAEKAEK